MVWLQNENLRMAKIQYKPRRKIIPGFMCKQTEDGARGRKMFSLESPWYSLNTILCIQMSLLLRIKEMNIPRFFFKT